MLYVTSPEQAKKSARALERFAKKEGLDLSHGQALDAVSVLAGSEDWNALAAALVSVRGLPVPANAVLALTLSRVSTVLTNSIKALAAENLEASGRRALSELSRLHEEASGALEVTLGSAGTVDELFSALGDLVEAVDALPDGSLPDTFNHRALSDAKITVSASRPSSYRGRPPEVRHGGAPRPLRVAQQEPQSSVRGLVDTSTYRLFYSGAVTKTKDTEWSMELLLAKPGQMVGEVARAAFRKREAEMNPDNIVFWFSSENPTRVGGFSVCLHGESSQHDVDSLASAVELAEQLSIACNRKAYIKTRTTGVWLAEFEPE